MNHYICFQRTSKQFIHSFIHLFKQATLNICNSHRQLYLQKLCWICRDAAELRHTRTRAHAYTRTHSGNLTTRKHPPHIAALFISPKETIRQREAVSAVLRGYVGGPLEVDDDVTGVGGTDGALQTESTYHGAPLPL